MADTTFITNEAGQSLSARFAELIAGAKAFDCLVGYFYASGFHLLYKSLQNTERIRILIGMKTDRATFEAVQKAQHILSTKEVKEHLAPIIKQEVEESEDTADVEAGIRTFIEWLVSGKLEIRVYRERNIHAKVYIFTFKEGAMDSGRVITGSSNFTRSGFQDNLEFNVELKDSRDYEFALNKFNDLWKQGTDVTQEYVQTLQRETWLREDITPYELYLKFLYEYLKEKINMDTDPTFVTGLPKGIKNLEYQRDAVQDAKTKVEEYGGVFLSDVVGLGKTYIAALLAKQLGGRHLVIAPPGLLDENNPGSWKNVFYDFGIPAHFVSIGKLDGVLKRGTECTNVFIDESHRFRTEQTERYEKLAQICSGKRVILVSATPLNNTPMDILSQIKLFQHAHLSTLPNPKVHDLEQYFKWLDRRLKDVDRQEDRERHVRIVKDNAKQIREDILRHLMVRRTRKSIERYYGEDLRKNGITFPSVEDPKPLFYLFDKQTDEVFTKTLELIIEEFTYSRYTPLLYLKRRPSQAEEIAQRNMGKFMKILLVKRLESSFYAFRKTLNRFIESYTRFLREYEKGNVYFSKRDINKLFALLEEGREVDVQKLLETKRAQKYQSSDFTKAFEKDLKKDLDLLKNIEQMWLPITADPKISELIGRLRKDEVFRQNKIILFTESRETAEYLGDHLQKAFGKQIIVFTGKSGEAVRGDVIENFDPGARHRKDSARVLISTDILSEGVNLHRSNVVINYDIPWNLVRMMQRVGRVNRLGTVHKNIHTYNFFPAGQLDAAIGLKALAEAKLQMFIEMLGNDARLLTDEEIKSHDLFERLSSKKTIIGEDEEDRELHYLKLMRNIRDTDKVLFERIKHLPKKARTARLHDKGKDELLTFFRRGKLRKIFVTDGQNIEELDFLAAADRLQVEKGTRGVIMGGRYYSHLARNKEGFIRSITGEDEPLQAAGRGYEGKLIKIIKAIWKAPELTEDDEDFLQWVVELLQLGSVPKQTMKKIVTAMKKETSSHIIVRLIRAHISPDGYQRAGAPTGLKTEKREVILSEHFVGGAKI